MAQHRITLLPGDGIGPEVTASVVSIIECAGVDVQWEKYFVGSEAISRFGDPLRCAADSRALQESPSQ